MAKRGLFNGLSFYIKSPTNEKEIAALNAKHAEIEPEQTEVVHPMVSVPQSRYMPETVKAIQLLLEQDRRYQKEVTRQRELQMIEEYLKNPSKKDYLDILEREKKLKLEVRFNKYFNLNLPDEMVETVRNNATKELKSTIKTYDKTVEEYHSIQSEILRLEALKEEVADEIQEMKQCLSMNNVFTQYIDSRDHEILWGTAEFMQNGYATKTVNGLRKSLSMAGSPMNYFTETSQPYYEQEFSKRKESKR